MAFEAQQQRGNLRRSVTINDDDDIGQNSNCLQLTAVLTEAAYCNALKFTTFMYFVFRSRFVVKQWFRVKIKLF